MCRSLTASASAVALIVLSAACDTSQSSQAPAPRSSTVPPTVSQSATEATFGFSAGVVREKRKLAGFEITKHPITNAWLSDCQAAGACSADVRVDVDVREEVALSVSPQAASELCAWLGGRLPTLEEWLVAARGSEPRRFAWGDALPSCAQHPRAATYYDDHTGKPIRADMPDCSAPTESAARRVGHHVEGAAPSGLEDVLLTAGELLHSSDDATFPACALGQPCVIYGLEPGAIDAVIALPQERAAASDVRGAYADPTLEYSFRCAFDGESSP